MATIIHQWKIWKEAVALSGLEGCTVSELLHFVAKRVPSEKLDYAKSHLWSATLHEDQVDISFYELSSDKIPFGSQVDLANAHDCGTDPDAAEVSTSPRLAIVDDVTNKIRGCCSHYDQRKAVTSQLKTTKPSLDEAQEMFGERLVLVASQDMREKVIIGDKIDSLRPLDASAYSTLELIAMSRDKGVSRHFIYKEFLRQSIKTSWSILRKLEHMNLIIETNISESMSETVTGYCLKVFKIKELLSSTQGTVPQPMEVEGVKEGEVSGGDLSNDENNENNENDDEEDDDDNQYEDSALPIAHNLPLDYQLYNLVDACGPTGIYKKDLRRRFDMLGISGRAMLRHMFYPSVSLYTSYTDPYDKSIHPRIVTLNQAQKNQMLLRYSNQQPKWVLQDEHNPTGEASADLIEGTKENPIELNMEVGLNVRQRKRLHAISSFFQAVPISVGHQPIRDYINAREKEEGRSSRIDRKTFERLLQSVIDAGDVWELKVQVTADVQGNTKEEVLYFLHNTPEASVQKYTADLKAFYDSLYSPEPEVEDLPAAEQGSARVWDDYGKKISGKFQKARHLHLYFWLLLNACPDKERDNISLILPTAQYPWVPSVLERIDEARRAAEIRDSDDESGKMAKLRKTCSYLGSSANHLQLREALNEMPLSLLMLTVGVYTGRGMESKLNAVRHYILDESYAGVPYKKLPKSVVEAFKGSSYKSRSSVWVRKMSQIWEILKELKLVEYREGDLSGFMKDFGEIEITTEATFLDTSTQKPVYSFFTESDKADFPQVDLKLNSLQEVMEYWFKLSHVCISTQIFKKPHIIALDCTMEYPTAEGDDSRSLGSGLFGAAGLPPKMYSHIQKNWHTSLQPVTLKREPTQTLGDEENEENPQSYSGNEDRRPLKSTKRTKKGLLTLEVTKSYLTRRQGGRGMKRAVNRSAEGMNRKRFKEDQVADWTTEEDKILLMGKIAQRVLIRMLGGTVDVEELLLENNYITDRGLTEIRRRILHLMKQSHFRETIAVTSQEIICSLKRDNQSQQPSLNFTELLQLLKTTYKDLKGIKKSVDFRFPQTLSDLQANYLLIDPHENMEQAVVPYLSCDQDILYSILQNIILSILLTDMSAKESYAAFKVLETFSAEDLQAVYTSMKDRLILQPSKAVAPRAARGARKSAVFTGMKKYAVSARVQAALIGGHTDEHREQVEHLYSQLARKSKDIVSLAIPENTSSTSSISKGKRKQSLKTSQSDSKGLLQFKGIEMKGNEVQRPALNVLTSILAEDHLSEMYTPTADVGTDCPSNVFAIEDDVDDQDLERGSGALYGWPYSVSERMVCDSTVYLLQPKINMGQLLSPVEPKADTPPQSISMETASYESTPNDKFSKEDFFSLLKAEYEYSDDGVKEVAAILQEIEKSGHCGLPMKLLSEGHPSSGDIVQLLLGFGLVHRVGTVDVRLVGRQHCSIWYRGTAHLENNDESPKESRCSQSQFHIWTDLGGTGYNQKLLDEILNSVLRHICKYPCVTWGQVKEQFTSFLQEAALINIVSTLILDGLVSVHSLQFSCESCSLFQESKTVISNKGYEFFSHFEDAVYLKPTIRGCQRNLTF